MAKLSIFLQAEIEATGCLCKRFAGIDLLHTSSRTFLVSAGALSSPIRLSEREDFPACWPRDVQIFNEVCEVPSV